MTVPARPRQASAERDEWLTVDEVCTELKISRRTFDRWRALGTGPRCKRLAGNGTVRIRRSWLEQWLDTHEQEGFAPVRERWRELSSTLGQEVLVKSERRELRGVAQDIDTDGALLLRTEDGLERVLAGDVEQVRSRVRP